MPNPTEPTTDDCVAAYDYRETLLSRADGHNGVSPWWYGWVIADAYIRGLADGRNQSIPASSDVGEMIERLVQNATDDVAISVSSEHGYRVDCGMGRTQKYTAPTLIEALRKAGEGEKS